MEQTPVEQQRERERAYDRARYRAHPEIYKARRRAYYQANRETVLAKQREYNKQHIEERRKRCKERREEIRAIAREHYKNNREKYVEYARRYMEKYREAILARQRARGRRNRELNGELLRAKRRETVAALTDKYVCERLGIRKNDLPDTRSLIELKRAQLQLCRAIKGAKDNG